MFALSFDIQEYGTEKNLFDTDYFCRKVKLLYLDENIIGINRSS